MIRPIDIKLNAAHPELPLVEATTFTGAPSSVFIRGVPKNCGNWSITAVNVAVTYPDNSTTTRAAVESAEGVWVATIPGTATSGRTVAGFRILADGIDENGAAVTGYVLGFADFSVFSFLPVPAPGETFYLLRYFDTMPTTPKKGDATVVSGVLKYYNGTTWLPFTDLSNYYTKTETDNAIDALAAYYITYNAAGAAFPTRADLINATTYYSGGVVRVPTRNDYAVVLADEAHGGAEYRYIYAVPDGATTGQWEAQYPIETNDYIALSNKPQINGNTLTGASSQSGVSLGLQNALSKGRMTGGQILSVYAEILDGQSLTLLELPTTFWLTNGLDNKANSSSIAAVFDASKQGGYAVGDVVMYNGARYRCTTAHTGAWDAGHFETQTVEAAKADDNAVVKLTGDQTISGSKTFTGTDNFYDFTVSHPQGQGYVRIYASANENRVHIEFSDAVSGSHGELFLPVLGGYGAVTLAAIENLAPDAFLMLYDGATVDLNTLYCYQGRLYRCILGYTFQSGDSYPPDDTTHWTLATVEDVLAALRTAIAGKANASDLPYAISESIPLTVTSGAAATTLADRTHNVRTVAAPGSGNTTTITATLPPIVAGKSRDMFLNLTVGTQASDAGDISLSIVEPSGATVQIDIGSVEDIGVGENEIMIFERALPTTSGNVTTTHWLVTVRHEDFAS